MWTKRSPPSARSAVSTGSAARGGPASASPRSAWSTTTWRFTEKSSRNSRILLTSQCELRVNRRIFPEHRRNGNCALNRAAGRQPLDEKGLVMPATYGFLSTYPPTQCGLATFNAALATHLNTGGGSGVVRLLASDNISGGIELDLGAPRVA